MSADTLRKMQVHTHGIQHEIVCGASEVNCAAMHSVSLPRATMVCRMHMPRVRLVHRMSVASVAHQPKGVASLSAVPWVAIAAAFC